jgi:hypothetical protein
MVILSRLICKFNAFPVKIPTGIFLEIHLLLNAYGNARDSRWKNNFSVN